MASKSRWFLCFSLSLMFFLVFSVSARATTVQLLTNGNFATGTFAGWTEADQAGGFGSWFVSSSNLSPVVGFTTPGPFPGDSFYAVNDQGGSGAHVLLQSFTVPVATTSLLLTFNMFSDDRNNGPFCPGPLDFTVSPNECARVDILTGAAGNFDTGAGVVSNLYDTASLVSGGPPPGTTNPWVSYSFILAGLTPGSTYQLRFGEVDNQFFFQQGVADVSLAAAVTTPEPSSLLLLCTGLLGMVIVGATRRKRLA